jgi:hypothetical protein
MSVLKVTKRLVFLQLLRIGWRFQHRGYIYLDRKKVLLLLLVHNTQKKDRKRRDLIKKEEGDTVRHIDRDRHMDYSESFVKEHIEKWVKVWNNHDLKAVLSCILMILNSPVPKSK